MSWRYNRLARFETYDFPIYTQRQRDLLNSICRHNAVLVFYSKIKVSRRGVRYQLAHLHDDDRNKVYHVINAFKIVR